MRPKGVVRVAVFILAVLTFGRVVFAQTTGTIRGTVKDPSGAVIPGAQVTVTLLGTETSRTVPTDKDGDYEIAELAVGHYSLAVDASGFKKFIVKDVDVTIGHVALVNAALEVGASAQTVTVEAMAAQVETTSTQLGAVMNDTAISQLPLNTRNTYALLQLQPGVQSQLGSNLYYGSTNGGVVSVNGGRGRSNNYMVNGGDANDVFVNLPAVQPSPDAVQEFRVITNTFDAEFGRNSGAVVDVVTKSGTNDLHGDVYEFFRNKVLNARPFFAPTTPDNKQNQFGFTLGAPVKKDQTFLFGSYEGRRLRQGTPSDAVTIPTINELNGIFDPTTLFTGTVPGPNFATVLAARSNNQCGATIKANTGITPSNLQGQAFSSIFPGNIIPKVCFDQTALDLANQFILPLAGANTPQIVTIPEGSARDDQFTIRFDHKINASQQFSAYYYFTDNFQAEPFSTFQASGANIPGFGDFNASRFQQWNLSHTWTIGSSAVNEFRFSYFREGQGKLDHSQNTGSVQSFCKTVLATSCFLDHNLPNDITQTGIFPNLSPSREGLPLITVGGSFTIGNNFEGELPQVGNTFQWSDSYSKVWGKHSLKFGGDVRRIRFDQTLFFDVNGDLTISGGSMTDIGFSDLIPNYLLGQVDTYTQGAAQQEHIRGTALYLFAQDSWKIKSNVTLNYGLRWELTTPLADIGRRVQTFRPGQADTIFPCALQSGNPLGNPGDPCGPGSPLESVFPRGLVVPGDTGVPKGLTQTYYKSFAPRIGLAWSPGFSEGFLAKLFGGPGKSSIRMGFGIFYNPIEQLVLEQFSAEPPFGGSPSLSSTIFNTPFLSQFSGSSPNAFTAGVRDPARGSSVDWSIFRPIVLFGEAQPNMRTQYSDQYNLTIQRELVKNLLFQIGYVGSQGHRLLATHDLNPENPQSCLDLQALSVADGGTTPGCGPFGEDIQFLIPAGTMLPPASMGGQGLHLPYGSVSFIPPGTTLTSPINLVGLRPFSSPFCEPTRNTGCPPDGVPVFVSIFAEDTIGNSNYNSLQLLLEKRFSNGLQLQGAYTYSKSIDQASSFEDILNPHNFRLSRSLSQFDDRQRFVLSYYWELPIPKREGFMGKLVNGWATSGIITEQAGFPIRLGISSNSSLTTNDQELLNSIDFATAGEPDLIAPFRRLDPHMLTCAFGTGPSSGTGAPCKPVHLAFDGNAIFANQALGTIGNAPRTICCGPGINNFELALHKSTRISERLNTEFRAEFFNAFNHTQFINPDGNIADGADFGRVKTTRDPRLIQFGLKLQF